MGLLFKGSILQRPANIHTELSTPDPADMTPAVPNYVAFNIPVLKGSSNWDDWHERFLRVTCAINPVHWDIFTGKVGPPVRTDCDLHMHFCEAAVSNDCTMDVSVPSKLDQISGLNASDKEVQHEDALRRWSRSVSEAREYLLFTLDPKTAAQIREVSDAREAYLKLEQLYSPLHAQPLVHFWQEWLEIRYQGTKESPQGFVRRFKKALRTLKDQGIQVSSGVEIAQFQVATMQSPEGLQFVNTLPIDPERVGNTESVYVSFLQNQTPNRTLTM